MSEEISESYAPHMDDQLATMTYEAQSGLSLPRRAPREIIGDVIESNIIKRSRARRATDKARK